METITVFTIVYNNYGHFIPQWLDYINRQTISLKKMVVLGKEHGADIDYLNKNNIKYIFCDSDNMGKLRNAGVKEIDTEWWQYFAVDDELLPHACEEIVNTEADAVSLRFNAIEPNGDILKDQHSPKITNLDELLNWKTCWGGYVAVRKNTDLRFREDIEVPNLSFHMEMFRRGLKVVESKSICVIHHRRADSHHFKSAENGSRRKHIEDIEKQMQEIYDEYVKRGNSMEIEALINYTDNILKNEIENKTKIKRSGKEIEIEDGKIQKSDRYTVSKERGQVIVDKGYAKLINYIIDTNKSTQVTIKTTKSKRKVKEKNESNS